MGGMVIAASPPSRFLVFAGLLALLVSIAPMQGAVLGGRVFAAVLGIYILVTYYLVSGRASAAVRVAGLIEGWDPSGPLVRLRSSVEYRRGWLVVEAIRGSRGGRVSFIPSGGPGGGDSIVFEGRYLLVYKEFVDYVLVLPAVWITDRCCRGAIVAVVPSGEGLESEVLRVSACKGSGCPYARLVIKGGEGVVEAYNPGGDRLALTICARPREVRAMPRCVDLARIEPGWTRTSVDLTLPPMVLVTHKGYEPRLLARKVFSREPPPLAGDLLGMAEFKARLRKLILGTL